MSTDFDIMPKYYNGKEIKILWECKEFNLVEIQLIGYDKTMVVDAKTITDYPKFQHYISLSLLKNK